ncbi:biotin-dependent carboxyltransferase family protein [Terrihabitans sp. B22-R8]|uniref:biotin-dependent carboxyltransferase family protein n=1 Tax=Terrihabitans sp. B22-R8 TaxID=3425128 RepID=UPI00403CE0E1
MSGLDILEGGLQTLVQDLGRPGFLSLGVSKGGALDSFSFRLGNLLVGNDEGAAALEVRSPGPVFRVTAPRLRLALAGSSAGLIVEREGEIAHWVSWRAVDVHEGDIIRVPPFADSAIASLHVAGGIAVPRVLGSRATSLRGSFGGLDGRALRTGDHVPCGAGDFDKPLLTLIMPPVFPALPRLRIIPGPQDDHFTPAAMRILVETEFTVSREFDRIGLRLDGPKLAHAREAGIPSDGTAAGAIQVPVSGQPIVLLADCQSTGGYPKIATIITADLDLAGRLNAGMKVRFDTVDQDGAAEARRMARHLFEYFAARLAPVREPARL